MWPAFLLLLLLGVAQAETVEVRVEQGDGFHWDPFTVDIHVGDTVNWVWYDDNPHEVISGDGNTGRPDGVFDSGIHSRPFTFSVTFRNVARLPYFCGVHYRGNHGGTWPEIRVSPATSTPPVLGNISTRLRVESGDSALIGGFILTGTQPKKVIVRAIGSSLPFAGKLENPTLELHGPGGLIASNDNWRTNQEAEIIASTVPPGNDLESAIVATLPANGTGYTAIVRGAGGGTGIGLVEVYNLDQAVDSKLANISSRGLVQTDDNVMIGGFIISGTGSKKVIIRAIGPSLPVPGNLADPTLELYDSNGVRTAMNDDWRSDQEAEIIASTVQPPNNLESAIVATLPPGGRTAIVRGKNRTTGVASVEVYALD